MIRVKGDKNIKLEEDKLENFFCRKEGDKYILAEGDKLIWQGKQGDKFIWAKGDKL